MLTRSKPMRRRSRLRPRRAKPRKSERRRDTAYLLWVKSQPCCAPHGDWPCVGDVQAHHAGKRAAGRKADDDTAIPLSFGCHHRWHDAVGQFAGWTRQGRREWADTQIAITRAKWESLRERDVLGVVLF